MRYWVFPPCCDYAHIQMSPPYFFFLPALHPLRSLPRPPCHEELPSKALWESPKNKASENVKREQSLGLNLIRIISQRNQWSTRYKICRVNTTCITELRRAADLNKVNKLKLLGPRWLLVIFQFSKPECCYKIKTLTKQPV